MRDAGHPTHQGSAGIMAFGLLANSPAPFGRYAGGCAMMNPRIKQWLQVALVSAPAGIDGRY